MEARVVKIFHWIKYLEGLLVCEFFFLLSNTLFFCISVDTYLCMLWLVFVACVYYVYIMSYYD